MGNLRSLKFPIFKVGLFCRQNATISMVRLGGNMENYYTLAKESISEIEIKKSKFLAYVKGTPSEEEALAYIAAIKKLHRDATHHCSAFRIVGPVGVERYDDDGEPSKTAGLPMLSVLQGRDLWNITGVVVRYFGGTLLGTGGLTRAYSEALREGLKANEIVYQQMFSIIELKCGYHHNDKVAYELNRRKTSLGQVDYGERVGYQVFIEKEKTADFVEDFQQLTDGQAQIRVVGQKYGYYYQGRLMSDHP